MTTEASRVNRVDVNTRACAGGGHVCTVILDNQTKLNTLNPQLIADATAALKDVARDDDARAVVITGAGSRSFIGGADVTHMVTLEQRTARDFITSIHHLHQAVLDIPVPVIGRVNGYALGAGMEFIACCDWRIASDNAEFGMPEVHVGIPSVIEAVRLPQLIGWGRTRELLLTGRWIKADEAARIGLIEQVVSADELDAAVDASLDLIVQAAPGAIRNQKALIGTWESLSLSAGVQAGIDAFERAYNTDEPDRYMQAFVNRKKK